MAHGRTIGEQLVSSREGLVHVFQSSGSHPWRVFVGVTEATYAGEDEAIEASVTLTVEEAFELAAKLMREAGHALRARSERAERNGYGGQHVTKGVWV